MGRSVVRCYATGLKSEFVRVPASSVPQKPVLVLVDDDAAVAHAVKFAFELDGFEVRTYPDGEGLLAAPLPDRGCLVLDQHLPGLDGLDVLQRLRERGATLPAVLITTNPNRSLRNRARLAGAPIVEKPLLCDALLERVRAAVA